MGLNKTKGCQVKERWASRREGSFRWERFRVALLSSWKG